LEKHPRAVAWKALNSLPRVKLKVPLVCQIFNWSETVEWEGIRLVDFLDFLKVETHPEGYYAIYSRDGMFFETLSRDEARDPRVLLAYGLNGDPLPEAHGAPLRLVVPFLQGYKSVKWVGAVRAFRHDPIGIKRLLGQSPTAQLNETWRERFKIVPPSGRAGDPPTFSPAESIITSPSPQPLRTEPTMVQGTVEPLGWNSSQLIHAEGKEQGVLREITAIVRPSRRLATRQALEAAGIVSYTTYGVLGRSRQRGLKLKSSPGSAESAEVAIKFLPKQLFSIVVEESQVKAAVNAIIKANRTGKGQYGDGKIFVLETEQAIRISTDERGRGAL
jgi:nitrogen regulatory protein PII/DMSO/TMAO reductase YedYZ molybdopterin-dependent catalytic subunit